ncbi:hypothetical protein H8958_016164 [Nasalis larvatus]
MAIFNQGADQWSAAGQWELLLYEVTAYSNPRSQAIAPQPPQEGGTAGRSYRHYPSQAPLHQLSLYVLLDLQEECAGDNPEEEVPPITGHLGLIGLIGPPWDRERREIWAFLALRAALGRGTDADCEVGEALLPLWDCPSSPQLSVVLWVPSAVVPRQPTLEGQSLRDPPTQLQPGRFLLRMVKLRSRGGRGMSWGLPREKEPTSGVGSRAALLQPLGP